MGDIAIEADGEIRTGPFGSQLHKHDYVEAETATPVVMPRDMVEGRIDTSSIARIDDVTRERLSAHILRPGDIVLGRRGEIGRRAWVGDYESGWLCGTGSMRISIQGSQEVVPRYLYYFLELPSTVGWLQGHSVGATMSNLSAGVVQQLPVVYPSVDAQQTIVCALDTLETLIENNRRRIEILEEMARLLYQEWFVQFRFPGHEAVAFVDSNLGPIPETWVAGVFADLVSEARHTVDPEEIPASAPVVGLEHLPRRSTTLQRWATASSVGSRRKIFEQGDILFAKIRPYFHKVVDAPFTGYASTDAIVFRPKSASLGARALAVASSDDFVGIATATSNGTRMPRANTELLMSYGVPHPSPLIEQAFNETVGPMNRLRRNLADQSRCLSKARDLLLPRLVSGELDISNLHVELEAEGV